MAYEAQVFSVEDEYVVGELTVSEKGLRFIYRLKGRRAGGLFGAYEDHPLQETLLSIAQAEGRLQMMQATIDQFAEAIAAARQLGAK